jgi:hypothetical protein
VTVVGGWTRLKIPRFIHGSMAGGDHGLTKDSPGPAMSDLFTPTPLDTPRPTPMDDKTIDIAIHVDFFLSYSIMRDSKRSVEAQRANPFDMGFARRW